MICFNTDTIPICRGFVPILNSDGSINGYIQKPVKLICFTVYYDRHLNTTGDMLILIIMRKEIKMWEV